MDEARRVASLCGFTGDAFATLARPTANLREVEREILAELARGATPDAIADRLLLHSRGVEDHLAAIARRTGIRTPAEARAFMRDEAVAASERHTTTARPTLNLTSREVEVVRRIAAGYTNARIAEELVISLHTANRHVKNILDKTGATNRAAAARLASEAGLLG
jgi:DNA-binding NarL/FixJ family response regulator